MATIAKVTRRDGVCRDPRARGVEHARGRYHDLHTLCGLSYDGPENRDWYYGDENLGSYCEPMTGEVTCKRCLRILAATNEGGS